MQSTHYDRAKEPIYSDTLVMHTIQTVVNYAKDAKTQNSSEHSGHYMKKLRNNQQALFSRGKQILKIS